MPVQSADILIADEIVSAINAAELSLDVTAERLYAADWDIKAELSTLQVGVWPAETTAEAWQRNKLQRTYRIGITFAKRVSAATIATLDALCDLVEEVVALIELSLATLDDGRAFVNQGWEYVMRFDANRLDRNKGADEIVRYTGVFASMVSFDFASLE